MNPIQRLEELPAEILQTFHPDFIFLIESDKIQHFPARNMSHNQKIQEVKKRLDHSLMVTYWKDHEIIYSPELNVFAVLPKE
ncbi:hypothetical protein [Candidatus Enterococcus courvalinii]|uniref:Uncharacterized protein n=1 Tax=Candidatus Enterococcus courvalinii TaxID=2815329 RepID=A0ABS3HZX4_9ENTE|nr:hypothetical protein [Enterococcus sp. MSG2901]MBO0481971.1 hypothetical protein [Enterococcus sp. MSG2901]